jgi:hypothetical protein
VVVSANTWSTDGIPRSFVQNPVLYSNYAAVVCNLMVEEENFDVASHDLIIEITHGSDNYAILTPMQHTSEQCREHGLSELV